MKKIILAAVIVMLLLSACEKKTGTAENIKKSGAVIIGRDLTKCACCWGWIISINNTSYKFDKVPAGSAIDPDNLVYPAAVNVTWRDLPGNCSGKLIEIVSISQ
ncbi:MAG: hypothetical protein WDO16_02030 [Bacteroidota bacterium]